MLHLKTTLILGAGASCPYGFPSGQDLIAKIVAGCERRDSPFREALREAGGGEDDIDKLRVALRDSQFYSIDVFLEYHPELLRIGKLAIAAALIPFEVEQKLLNPDAPPEHWYRVLFNHMVTPSGFQTDKLSIITLNYDRSLEQYLFLALTRDLRLQPDEAVRVLSRIDFIHLHGQLGRLTWQSEGDPPVGRRASLLT